MKKTSRSALTFSGGVDSFTTLLSYINEKPDLVTIWGADIDFDNEKGWRQVKEQVTKIGKSYGLRNFFLRASILKFVDNTELGKQYREKLGDDWWHAMQHGIGLVGLMAPYAYTENVTKILVPSSFRRDEDVLCASSAGIMEAFRFGNTKCVYDDKLGDRQAKTDFIMGGATAGYNFAYVTGALRA